MHKSLLPICKASTNSHFKRKGHTYFPNTLYPQRAKDKSSINVHTMLLGWNILSPQHLGQTKGKSQGVRGLSSSSVELPANQVMLMHGFWKEVLIKTQSDLGCIYTRGCHPASSLPFSGTPPMQSQMPGQLFRLKSEQLFGSLVRNSCCKHCGAESTPPWASRAHHVCCNQA